MPFDKDDPRSVLVAPSSDDATAATEFSPAQFIPFTDDVADHSGRGTKTWVVRVRNAAVAHSSGVASDRLDGMGDDSDRLFALTDDDTVVRLTHDGETFTVSGRSVVVVPPGPVSVEFVTAGNLRGSSPPPPRTCSTGASMRTRTATRPRTWRSTSRGRASRDV